LGLEPPEAALGCYPTQNSDQFIKAEVKNVKHFLLFGPSILDSALKDPSAWLWGPKIREKVNVERGKVSEIPS
jgi:hypothetical protein